LLTPVEMVYFIDEKRGGTGFEPAPIPSLVDDATELWKTSEHRTERHEKRSGVVRKNPSQGGLAGARRPPEDQGRDPIALDRLVEQFPRRQKLGLPDQFVEGARAHSVGQGGLQTFNFPPLSGCLEQSRLQTRRPLGRRFRALSHRRAPKIALP